MMKQIQMPLSCCVIFLEGNKPSRIILYNFTSKTGVAANEQPCRLYACKSVSRHRLNKDSRRSADCPQKVREFFKTRNVRIVRDNLRRAPEEETRRTFADHAQVIIGITALQKRVG